MKRLIDLIFSISGLILLLPLLIIVSVLIYFNLGSPIIFEQSRIGHQGKVFNIFKFRTMKLEENYSEQKEILRLTPLTSFLRSVSLDELPTLFNVLLGSMSIVGPRPLLEEYREEYTEEQFRRHNVMPGVTGWAQINGRNNLSWEEKFEYDLWYVDNASILLDMKIILLTIYKTFIREGVNQSDIHTMERFRRDKRK